MPTMTLGGSDVDEEGQSRAVSSRICLWTVVGLSECSKEVD